MPLEPIEEGDLDLKSKFIEKAHEENQGAAPVVEIPSNVEESVERKEGAVEREEAYSKILSKVKTQSAPAIDHAQVKTDADMASEAGDVRGRVERLVDLAMQKGVVHAVQVARHLDDNYMLDQFHDKLVAEELHNALMEKGLIRDL